MSVNAKVHKSQNSDLLTVESGGEIKINTGGKVTKAGVQASVIALAKVNYTAGDLDAEAKIITAINATNTKINSIIAALEGVGITATE